MRSEYYDYNVCEHIYNLSWLGEKYHHPESNGYFFEDRLSGDIVFMESLPEIQPPYNPIDTTFRDRYIFKCYAYKKQAVKESAKRIVTKTKKPLKFEDIEKLVIKSYEKIKEEKKVKEYEDEMAKEIKDTGVKVVKLNSSDFLSVDASKELFRKNSKAKTKFAWYECKITFDRFVALEFFKDGDLSTADIDWLGTQYRYLYMAFEVNGAALELVSEPVKISKKKKDIEKSSISTEKVAQSSQKITQGKITNSNSDLLPIYICRRLWILSKTSQSNWNWYMLGVGRNSSIFPAEEGKQGEATMICRAFLKTEFEGLFELCEGLEEENVIKHIVNAYFFER